MAAGDMRLIGEVIRRGLPHKWKIALSLVGHAVTGAMLAYLLAQLAPFIKYLGTSMAGGSVEMANVATDNLCLLYTSDAADE